MSVSSCIRYESNDVMGNSIGVLRLSKGNLSSWWCECECNDGNKWLCAHKPANFIHKLWKFYNYRNPFPKIKCGLYVVYNTNFHITPTTTTISQTQDLELSRLFMFRISVPEGIQSIGHLWSLLTYSFGICHFGPRRRSQWREVEA